jgi:FMN-binding protein
MHTRRSVLLGGASFVAALGFNHAFAAQFITLEQAQRSIFPEAQRFEEQLLNLTPQQLASIAKLAGPQPRHGSLKIWKALRGAATLGFFFVDEVIGRQDLITYAAGIDAGGKLSPIEVLVYRESHGGEIRNPAWCAQFKGRDLSNLRFPTDIKNIAGATLSSEHVTQGTRWVLAVCQVALQWPSAEQT